MLQFVVEDNKVEAEEEDDDGGKDQLVGLDFAIHGLDDPVLAPETVDVALGLVTMIKDKVPWRHCDGRFRRWRPTVSRGP